MVSLYMSVVDVSLLHLLSEGGRVEQEYCSHYVVMSVLALVKQCCSLTRRALCLH